MSSPTDTDHTGTERSRGSMTAFVVCITSLVVCVAGLVADGGRYVAAHSRASDTALAAARFGSQNMTDIRAGDPRVECSGAARDARSFASSRGLRAAVACDDSGVTVTISGAVTMRFLAIFGVQSRTYTVERRVEPMWG